MFIVNIRASALRSIIFETPIKTHESLRRIPYHHPLEISVKESMSEREIEWVRQRDSGMDILEPQLLRKNAPLKSPKTANVRPPVLSANPGHYTANARHCLWHPLSFSYMASFSSCVSRIYSASMENSTRLDVMEGQAVRHLQIQHGADLLCITEE